MDEHTNIQETAKNRRYSLINWGVHADEIKCWLEDEAASSVNQYFGKPFVLRSDELNHIQLSSGAHAIRHTSWDKGGHVVPGVASEHGAALVVTQHPDLATIAIILFPLQSDVLRPRDTQIVWGTFRNPIEITRNIIKQSVSDYRTWCRVTTATMTPSLMDRARINWLLLKSRKYTEGKGLFELFVTSWPVAAISLLFAVVAVVFAIVDHYHVVELLSRFPERS
jgi:hypothetical protein